MHNYLNDLNEVQQEAVKDINGPSLVVAGPGAGKTRVLTYRIAYLLSLGFKANSILALTFTNKAANEMKERIAKLVGSNLSRNLWMGTFHSIFAKILRFEGHHLGYPTNYTIYDTLDSKNLIKSIIKDLNLNDQIYKANEVLNRISSAKNNLITAQSYLNNTQITEKDKNIGKSRIADWELFGKKIHVGFPEGMIFRFILEKMDEEKDRFSLEDDPLFVVLKRIVIEDGEKIDEMSASELYVKLGAAAEDLRMKNFQRKYQSPISLGKRLGNVQDELLRAFDFEITKGSSNIKLYSFSPKRDLEMEEYAEQQDDYEWEPGANG